VDQIRTQLGWLQAVREQLGAQAEVTPTAAPSGAMGPSVPPGRVASA